MKHTKLILYFPACPQVGGGSATTGVNWEALLQVMCCLQLCSTGSLAEGGGASWEFFTHGRYPNKWCVLRPQTGKLPCLPVFLQLKQVTLPSHQHGSKYLLLTLIKQCPKGKGMDVWNYKTGSFEKLPTLNQPLCQTTIIYVCISSLAILTQKPAEQSSFQ